VTQGPHPIQDYLIIGSYGKLNDMELSINQNVFGSLLSLSAPSPGFTLVPDQEVD